MITDHQWDDTGQHFTISRGGLILEGRHGSAEAAHMGRVVEGAHAASSDKFGIEIEGDNREADQVTSKQYRILVVLCAWLTKWREIPSLPIIGHTEVLPGHTDCPGRFEQRLPALRQDVDTRRSELG